MRFTTGFLSASCCLAFALLACLPNAALAAPVRMAIMGDSISAGSTGTNWVGQLNKNYASSFSFQNKAQGGATSSSVVSGQLPAVDTLAKTSKIDVSVLIIGGNDPGSYASQLINGDSSQFIANYFANVKNIIDTIAHDGPGVHQVFGNMPDVTVTPAVLSGGGTPQQYQFISNAIGQANALANAYALSHNVPVIDLYTASHTVLAGNTFLLGGHTYTTAFASDGFHPASWVQGLLANLVDTAFNLKWGLGLPILSDQQIVRDTGFTPNTATTYYNIRPLILLPVPEPSTWALCLSGLVICLARARRDRRAPIAK